MRSSRYFRLPYSYGGPEPPRWGPRVAQASFLLLALLAVLHVMTSRSEESLSYWVRLVAWAGAAIFGSHLFDAVRTDSFEGRLFKIRRSRRPLTFWLQMLIHLCLTAACATLALFG